MNNARATRTFLTAVVAMAAAGAAALQRPPRPFPRRGPFANAAAPAAPSWFDRSQSEAWLRYQRLPPAQLAIARAELPYVIVAPGAEASRVGESAEAELLRGLQKLVGRTPREQESLPAAAEGRSGLAVRVSAIVLATPATRARLAGLPWPRGLAREGYALEATRWRGRRILLIAGGGWRGALYGVFALLRRMELGRGLESFSGAGAVVSNPAGPMRWVNDWDNLNGSIDRGYGGRSIFFADGKVLPDLGRVGEYGRLLASLGINGCVVNNVNADPRVLTAAFLPGLVRIAAELRPWGVRLGLAVPFSAPQSVGGLGTSDPLDPAVRDWWAKTEAAIYAAIPDFAGFLVKADSEGQPGPLMYHRTHAQGANAIAAGLAPHGGLLVYRAFVYKHPMDFHDLKADRAMAAYQNFAALDGKFAANVVIQIKNGPIDFQVREPVSPLIGDLRHTNEALELEVTQEYLGQNRQMVYLAPEWSEVLNFDLRARPPAFAPGTPVKAIVTGQTFDRPVGGMVGVVNVGQDANWVGSILSQANLFAFGRLAWNPNLSPEEIAANWTRLTFNRDPEVVSTLTHLLMASWPTYEDYTGSPLGLQTLTNIVGPHYGPGPESADDNGWGQWIRAGKDAIGMDRTVATGTGFLGEYSPPVAAFYASLSTCPDNLVLFFHHLPYTYRLHSGKTVIQTIYDSHFAGAAEAQTFPRQWRQLRGRVAPAYYHAVLRELEYQAGYSYVWRDDITNWFRRLTGIPDVRGRVGHYPGRTEAEAMRLTGYQVESMSPWEAASGGEYVACPLPAARNGAQTQAPRPEPSRDNTASAGCAASFTFQGPAGWYNLAAQYFDTLLGASRFSLWVNRQEIAHWRANDHLPSFRPDADSSTRFTARWVALRSGDQITVRGVPDGGEAAALDYVEIRPAR